MTALSADSLLHIPPFEVAILREGRLTETAVVASIVGLIAKGALTVDEWGTLAPSGSTTGLDPIDVQLVHGLRERTSLAPDALAAHRGRLIFDLTVEARRRGWKLGVRRHPLGVCFLYQAYFYVGLVTLGSWSKRPGSGVSLVCAGLLAGLIMWSRRAKRAPWKPPARLAGRPDLLANSSADFDRALSFGATRDNLVAYSIAVGRAPVPPIGHTLGDSRYGDLTQLIGMIAGALTKPPRGDGSDRVGP